MKSAVNDVPSIISNKRNLANFSAADGIILQESSNCGFGVVDFANNTTIVSERDNTNAYSPSDVLVPTTFTIPACARN